MSIKPELPYNVVGWLAPNPEQRVQSFEFYAAHFLVGSKLTCGDLEGHIRSLAFEFKKHYETGLEHGLRHPGVPPT